MTFDEIIKEIQQILPDDKIESSNYGSLCNISTSTFSKLFNEKVALSFDFLDSQDAASFDLKDIRRNVLSAFSDFLNLDKESISELHEIIWKHCLNFHQESKSSFDGGLTWRTFSLEEKMAESEILGREDALQKWRVREVYFTDDAHVPIRSFIIVIIPEWEEEHGIQIRYSDNEFKVIT